MCAPWSPAGPRKSLDTRGVLLFVGALVWWVGVGWGGGGGGAAALCFVCVFTYMLDYFSVSPRRGAIDKEVRALWQVCMRIKLHVNGGGLGETNGRQTVASVQVVGSAASWGTSIRI